MRIQVLSDLHIEFGPDHPAWTGIEPADADVIVLAGDIWLGTQGIKCAAEMAAAVGTPVRFLENDAAVIDDV